MVDFSKNPAATGFFAPQRFEAAVYDCEVRGKIPADLNGGYLRVGSQDFYPKMFSDDTPFNEDGYASLFRIKNGVVNYSGRWVKTHRYQANLKAGRQLFGYYRNPYTDDPSIRDEMLKKPYLRTVTNTAPMAHAGKIFALKEDGMPHELDPKTLETKGVWSPGPRYTAQTFTAHPKTDPVTGEMITYGYEASGLGSNDLRFYWLDKAGRVTKEVRLKTPYLSMIHDIAVSDKHIVIPIYGYVCTEQRLRDGKVHWGFDQTAPTYYGILPRDGEAKDIRWFKGPNRAIIHTANARTEGDKVILDAPIFDGNPFPFFPFVDGSKFDPLKARALLRRVTFDLSSKDDGYKEEVLFPNQALVDLVRIDDRYMGKPYRYVYAGFSDPSKPLDERLSSMRGRLTNSYARFDLQTRKVESFFAGPNHSLSEPDFVPNGPREGQGYLIGCASNYLDMRTELIIANAETLTEIARVFLPFRATQQVHGRWVNENQTKFA